MRDFMCSMDFLLASALVLHCLPCKCVGAVQCHMMIFCCTFDSIAPYVFPRKRQPQRMWPTFC